MLISINASYRLFGIDYNKPTHYQRDDLTKMAIRDTTKGLCAWVPSHFSVIQVTDQAGKKIDEIEQDTKLVIRQGLVNDITSFSDKHFHFYERTITLDEGLLNFTGFQSNIDHNWGGLVEHDRPVFNMRNQHGFFELGMIIVIAFILCLYAFKLVRCLRQRYGRPSAREAANMRDRVEYDRSNQTARLSPPPDRPPPPPPVPSSHDNTNPKYHSPRTLNASGVDNPNQIEDCPGFSSNLVEPPVTAHSSSFVGGDSIPPV